MYIIFLLKCYQFIQASKNCLHKKKIFTKHRAIKNLNFTDPDTKLYVQYRKCLGLFHDAGRIYSSASSDI